MDQRFRKAIFMLLRIMIRSSAAARSDLIGAVKPRAVCLIYLFRRNIKVRVSAEKSLKRLSKTSIFSEQNAWKFLRQLQLLTSTGN